MSNTTWRYCLSRESVDDGDLYAIREVYTDPDGKLSWTKHPIAPHGDSWAEIVRDLNLMSAGVWEVLDLTLDPPALVTPQLPEQIR